MKLKEVGASVETAPTGAALQLQIRNVTQGVDMLSTVLSIDATENTSDTAATPAVIDTNNDEVSDGDLLALDIDQVGSTEPGEGLAVEVRFGE